MVKPLPRLKLRAAHGGKAGALTDMDNLCRAEEFARREITLPLWPGMGEGAVEEVCAVVLGAARRAES